MLEQFENKERYLLGRKLDLLLDTGQLLIQSLADSNRIDRNMRRVAVFMGIPEDKFHMHINYTTLMINISDGHHSVTKFRKCNHHGVDMNILSEVSKLSWRAIEQKYSLEEYEEGLKKIKRTRKLYPRWLTIVSAGLACGGFCKLFGCDWAAFFITAIAASFAIFCRQEMHHRNFNMYMNIAVSALIATLISGFSSLLPLSSTPHHPIFASVLFLIPGVPIINCLDDMIDGFSIVGVTRAIIVFITLGAISFGMTLAITLLRLEDYTAILSLQSNWLIVMLAAAVSASGFSVLFNVPVRALLINAACGAMAVLVRNLFMYYTHLDLPLSSFLGAIAAATASIYLVHKIHVPAHVISIPPVIPMIPGVLMYKAMMGLLNLDAIEGSEQIPHLLQTLDSGVKATLTVVGISLGVAIPNVIGRKYFGSRQKKRMLKALHKEVSLAK